ncbi:MAG: NAD(P)H-hydrate dehydratase [Planctomycetota bacterium]
MINDSAAQLPTLPERAAASHKGDYGRVLVLGGSLAMAGAPAMTAMACLRSGAGLVEVATPRCVQPTVAAFCPAYTVSPLADDGERLTEAARPALAALLANADAAAIGPGLGRSEGVTALVSMTMTHKAPMVIDADGLNALADRNGSGAAPAGPRVLTPHAGELARLLGEPLSDPDDDAERLAAATWLVERVGGPETVVLLKGPRTVVTDGVRYAVNGTGNPGMATGGSGDVLTGVIAALLGQGLPTLDAARLAACVHGLAGDRAAAKLGQTALTAPDLIDALPGAWRAVGAP